MVLRLVRVLFVMRLVRVLLVLQQEVVVIYWELMGVGWLVMVSLLVLVLVPLAVSLMDEDPLRQLERELKQRRDAQRTLGRTIDELLKQTASDEARPSGCFALLSALFGSRRQRSRAPP